MTHLKRCRKLLVEYFVKDRAMAEISPGEAGDFHEHVSAMLVANTVRRAAVGKRLIAESPFGDMKATSTKANRSRDYFVTWAEADAVLKACPNKQWQLLFALRRYGRLRCPSEHLALTWGDVNWNRMRITGRSPKTAHHEGQEEPVMPLFPELPPNLQTALKELEDDSDFYPKQTPLSKLPIIHRYRDSNSILRTQL